ncbi:MAG TPA: farnesyl-diphosphate farnesyltransferase, partial [Verrucomicrobiales bacterium]|nr:farnesyl-diphosphate farnesyltransferase [Verrucomicrobiales bacterium]
MNTAELSTDILKAVSRSFYLTLRLLPSEFRAPLSLGYLLARLSDTIADAGALELAHRKRLLSAFCAVMKGSVVDQEAVELCSRLRGEMDGAGLV